MKNHFFTPSQSIQGASFLRLAAIPAVLFSSLMLIAAFQSWWSPRYFLPDQRRWIGATEAELLNCRKPGVVPHCYRMGSPGGDIGALGLVVLSLSVYSIVRKSALSLVAAYAVSVLGGFLIPSY